MHNWLAHELLSLLSIPSVTGQEKTILLHLEDKAEYFGLKIKRQMITKERWNILLNPQSNPLLVIVTHTDTVPETIQNESCEIKQDGNIIWGRGAADAKGSIAALLGLLHFAEKSGWDWSSIPVTLVFTVDEEKEGHGSEIISKEIKAKAGLVLEPTGLAVCVAQAGSLEARIKVSGRSAHGSVFEEGENAIIKAASIIHSLKNLPWLSEIHPLLGKAGYNVQWINGGSKELVIPNSCTFEVDFRILPGQDIEEIKRIFCNFCYERGLNYEITDISPPLELEDSFWLVDCLRRAGKRALNKSTALAGMPSWTDAENLASQGTPSVVFGPGKLGSCHTNREHVSLTEVEQAAKILFYLVQEVFSMRIHFPQ